MKDNIRIYEVEHDAMITGSAELSTQTVTTLIKAADKKEALERFNKLAKARSGYPYGWSQVTLSSIKLAKVY